jgi:23S rRNA-/tRNA-specific pseudouridylate synthase
MRALKSAKDISVRMIPNKTHEAALRSPFNQRCSPPDIASIQRNVLLETEDFIVIDKPCDVRMDGDFPITVEKILRFWYPAEVKFRWAHQLDFATSGVLCVARNKAAA